MNADEQQDAPRAEMSQLIEEARMVLPGIQTLFGFQTIAVFNQRFTLLPEPAVQLHLCSLTFVIVSIVIIMAAVSYHRIVEPGRVSQQLIARTNTMIWAAMLFLMLGLSLDMAIVVYLATGSATLGAGAGAAILVFCACAWFIVPLWMRARRRARP